MAIERDTPAMQSSIPQARSVAEPGLGFNGELHEPFGWQILGNGYRVYNPVLMRFHSPDSLSPFSDGGINPYAYCNNDPVNGTDPSGHFFLEALAGVVALLGFLITRPGRWLRGFTSKPIKNISRLERGLHSFEDGYKGGRRINFDSHSRAGHLKFGGEKQTVSRLIERAEQGNIDFRNYDSARLLVCRSADIPTPVGTPIAQEFANATGLPTKGFRGTVAASFPSQWQGPFDRSGEGTITLVRNRGLYSLLPNARRHYDPEIFTPEREVTSIRSSGPSQSPLAPHQQITKRKRRPR